MKSLKDLLIIPKNGPAYLAEVDPEKVGKDDIAIDASLVQRMKLSTTVPIDFDSEEILKAKASFLRRHGILKDKYSHTTPKTDKGRAYIENLQAPRTVKTQIDEYFLKQEILKACDEKAAAKGKIWIWDAQTSWMVRNMMYYFANDERINDEGESGWDLRKGILLYGNVGVGKTWLFEVFRYIARKHLVACGKNFKMNKCMDISKMHNTVRWKISKGIQLAPDEKLDRYMVDNWCFDDFGEEPLEINDFGNKTVLMEDIILERDAHFAAGRYLTHATTNLSLEEIKERYGLRLFDRMMQMMNAVEWKGESKRS